MRGRETHLRPTLPVSDLGLVLEVDEEEVSTWHEPQKLAAIRGGDLEG